MTRPGLGAGPSEKIYRRTRSGHRDKETQSDRNIETQKYISEPEEDTETGRTLYT